MYCWGNTENGELGLRIIKKVHVNNAQKLKCHEVTEVVKVASGNNHTLILQADGSLYSCGSNAKGQLGHVKTKLQPERVNIDAMSTIACGGDHSLTIDQHGRVYGWGSNTRGQLTSEEKYQFQPQVLPGLEHEFVVQVAAGETHSMALTNTGNLYTWGSNGHGELGLGEGFTDQNTPVLNEYFSGVGLPIAFIASGGDHAFAVLKSGEVYGWGKNRSGQLGLGDNLDKVSPTELVTLRNARIMHIACGDEFTAFLTAEGRIFTCGSGSEGQLGHGSRSHEIMPKQIAELMGSSVSQLACGSHHTMAYIPENGRVYTFGRNEEGQLGSFDKVRRCMPQPVPGPWETFAGENLLVERKTKIQEIFAGGKQSFAVMVSAQSNSDAVTHLCHPKPTQVLNLTSPQIKKILNQNEDHSILCKDDKEMKLLESVLGSRPCLNSSFLSVDNTHFCCSSRNSGVDLNAAKEWFTALSRIKDADFQDLVLKSISNVLIQTTRRTYVHPAALRVFLILPLYHRFDEAEDYETLHVPFATNIVLLNNEDTQTIGAWWRATSAEYFERLINICKSAIVQENSAEVTKNSRIFLRVLLKLYRINRGNQNDDTMVPNGIFGIPELQSQINWHRDLGNFGRQRASGNLRLRYICQFPIVLNSSIKHNILTMDQRVRRMVAANPGSENGMFNMMIQENILLIPDVNPPRFTVTRGNEFDSVLPQLLQAYQHQQLKVTLTIRFQGEVGAGHGVNSEFFSIVADELMEPKFKFFKVYSETRSIWLTEEPFQNEDQFLGLGLLCGLAIYNEKICNLPFPEVFFKKLFDMTPTLDDLGTLSPTMLKSLKDLLAYSKPDLSEIFSLTFEVTRDISGTMKDIPLKLNGRDIPVTQENKHEYVNLYVDYILNSSIESHFRAFQRGFLYVCDCQFLRMFEPHELMTLLVGTGDYYDWMELQYCTTYHRGYTEDHPTIINFWKVFHDYNITMKRKFLHFVTGCDRLPIKGMRDIKLQIHAVGHVRNCPRAHTCFHSFELPMYENLETLKSKLDIALAFTDGFGMA